MKDALIKSVVNTTGNILFLSLLVIQVVSAQYNSGITKPDTTQAISTDMSIPQVKWAADITADDLYAHLSVIASDEYEGRETGQPGNEKAADYIAQYFKTLGLSDPMENGTHFQPIAFTSSRWEETTLHVNGKKFKHLWDYMTFPTQNEDLGAFAADEVMFLGYGIDSPTYSDYAGKDVQGKVIMIYKGEPTRSDSTSYITGKKEWSEWSTNVNKKLKVAKDKGAKLVLIVEDQLKDFLFQNRKFLLGPKLDLGDLTQVDYWVANHMYISTSIAKEIIGTKSKKFKKIRRLIEKKGKSKGYNFPAKLEVVMDKQMKVIEGNNVLGLLPGTDKADEIIVVSAHYDHLGKKGEEIFNGADDNGSGTSTVLDIAESFVKAANDGNAPRRSILFMLVTGEEKGLLGSEYYAENPIYPLENTVADVNVDMVGRVDKRYAHDPNYVYVIGSDRLSKDLHVINEEMNQKYTQIILDYKYNDEKDPNRYYYRSDHYNFASRGIPAIFYFNGTHEDYHQPSDTIDKINFDKMAKVGQHIFHVTWELANRDQRIEVLKN